MSYSFRCPACQTLLCAAEHLADAHTLCPECDVMLVVPDPRQAPRAGVPASGATAAGSDLVADEAAVQFRLEQNSDEAEMDMTPMVDVTFLLLIFFMVTATFTMQKSFEVPTPEQEQASERPLQEIEDDPDYVIVRVDEFNTFFVSAALWDEEKEAPSHQDLLVRLRQARGDGAGSGATRMLVMASGAARHDKVVTALDAGAAVGMADVKLVTLEAEP